MLRSSCVILLEMTDTEKSGKKLFIYVNFLRKAIEGHDSRFAYCVPNRAFLLGKLIYQEETLW